MDTIYSDKAGPELALITGTTLEAISSPVTFDRRAIELIDGWAATNLTKPAEPLALTAAPPSPAKTNTAPSPPKRKRADLLTPVIDRAQAQANDPTDHSEVFATLRAWATSDNKPTPIIGYADGEGVQWQDGSDKVRWLNLAALRKRINRPPVAAKGR